MTELNHEFLLLSTREHRYTDYLKVIGLRKAIRIHDDLMNYMQDTMGWITCYNPARKMTKHKGLNFYGPTVIKKDGAVNAEKLFTAWADLFSTGPKRIKLTGGWAYTQQKGMEAGSYEIFKFERDELVAALRTLARNFKSVANSNDELFILHLGI
jgi:hypothetical protein